MNPNKQRIRSDHFDQESFDRLADRIKSAATSLLGNHPVRSDILRTCDDYSQRCEQASATRNLNVPVLAVLGLKGQGKSWCVRAMIHDDSTRSLVPSGVLSREATTKLYWVGPESPDELDSTREVYLHVDSSLLLDLDFPYVLLDTPGTTDADEVASQIASSAVSIAPVALMVTRQDQMRSAAVSMLAHRAEGAIVVPVITAISSRQLRQSQASLPPAKEELAISDETQHQVTQWTTMLRQSANDTTWITPIYVEDFEESGDEELAMERLQLSIQNRLAKLNVGVIQQSRHRRIVAIQDQMRVHVGQVVADKMPDLADAVIELRQQADKIPTQTIESILGSPLMLRVAVRNQLRTRWISDTPVLYFPYRTVLSLLSLTHGAWDRVVLALTGSLPSLFGSLTAWTRNVSQSRKLQAEIKEGLQQRIDAQVSGLLQPIHERFRHSLRSIRARGGSQVDSQHDSHTTIRLTGVDQLQIRSTEIFETELESAKTKTFPIHVAALTGTLIFWLLFAGPIVSIYRDYLAASYDALTSAQKTIGEFPTPPASLIFTSILLSALPLVIYCMFVMTGFLRGKRISVIADRILTRHHQLIQSLRSQGLLQLNIVDDELRDAQFLVDLESDKDRIKI